MKSLIVMLACIVLLLSTGCATFGTISSSTNRKDAAMDEKKKEIPKINLRFLYMMCNDIKPMRKFYTELIGLKEVSSMDNEKFGWLNYQCEGVCLMFFRVDEKIPVQDKWAGQPGGGSGEAPLTSFSLEIPESDFAAIVKKLKTEGAKVQSQKPDWRQECYWGITVMDPMGNTIEVYSTPKEKPESTQWP